MKMVDALRTTHFSFFHQALGCPPYSIEFALLIDRIFENVEFFEYRNE